MLEKQEKVKIKDFSEWIPYDGFSEGSGRSEKIWLQSLEGQIGLFKYPKVDPETKQITYEHISEHLAYLIAKKIGVETAIVDIGVYGNRYGSMSYLLNKEDEAVVEGINFIIGKHPSYDAASMMDLETGKRYCLEYIFEITDNQEAQEKWIQMMIFDFLIGNSDRHQNNWAILVKYTDNTKQTLKGKVCPLYDNGSSLCCFVNDNLLHKLLGKDQKRFEALVDTKSQSMIRIDGFEKKHPTHKEVVRYLLSNYKKACEFADKIINDFTSNEIRSLMDRYPESILTNDRKMLLEKYLHRKIEILKSLRNEVK